MRSLTCFRHVALAVFVSVGLPRLTYAQPSALWGVIEGRVSSPATGASLSRARVAVEGTDRVDVTDSDGTFRIVGVPIGTARVSVSYFGFVGRVEEVGVRAGEITRRDFELVREGVATETGATVKLQEFMVVANREMSAQAIAMNERRHAPNLKNVVAIDEFGDRGDENIGELLRFLPGVALNDSGHVPNEVTLRGFPSNNSGVMVDGGEVVGARGGNSRSVSLLEVPMGNISRVEVTKVPTPDMPASGLGGSINLITRNGFEASKPRLNYQAYFLFHSRNGLTLDGGPPNHVPSTSPDHIEPSFNFSYLHPIDRSVAISMGGSRTWRQKPMEDGSDTNEIAEWNLVDGFQRTSQWQSLAQVLKTRSGQIGVDWRISARDTVSASLQHRESDSYITRSLFLANYGAGVTGNANFSQGAATGVGTATQGSGANQDIDTATTLLNLKYQHKADAWRINAVASRSEASAGYRDVDRGHFATTPAVISNIIIRGDDVPPRGGILPRRYSAVTRTGAPVDLYDGGNYSLNSGTSTQSDYATMRASGRVDLAREFSAALPMTFKVGAAVDHTKRDQRRSLKTWNFRPNGSADVTARLAGRFAAFDEQFNQTAPTLYGRPMRWISPLTVYELFQERPDWFVLDEPLAYQNQVANSRRLLETVSAAYVRGDLRFLNNRLNIVTGVRFERTDAEGRGPLDDFSAQYQKNANGDFILNAAGQRVLITNDVLALRKLRYQERAAQAKRRYSGFYPSLNASYAISDNLVIRAAYARTLGRPDVNFVTPGTTITDPDVANPRITVSNTGLLPWTANGYDFTIESYHLKDGFGSIGVFQKDIKNFFGTSIEPATPALLSRYGLPDDSLYLDYDIATQMNSGDARIRGLEFSYRQSLTFLPAWARGLQIFFNGTWMELAGSNTADFDGFNPGSVAGGVNFIRSRFAIKVTCTHQGETRRDLVGANVANGIPPDTYSFQGERTRWGISAEYSLHKRFSVYGSIMDPGSGFNNLTRRYAPTTPEYARNRQLAELGNYITLGIKGSY